MYKFYIAGKLLPITPSKITFKVPNRNETASLIDDTTINRLKAPGLTSISFDVLIPGEYSTISPDAISGRGSYTSPGNWRTFFESLKINKSKFQFVVTRVAPSGLTLFGTTLTVTLEEYEMTEDAEDGDDTTIAVKLQTYETYNSKTYKIAQSSKGAAKATVTATRKATATPATAAKGKKYTVKSGDSLWLIAKKQYNNPDKETDIYKLNKSTIEATAKKYGRASSSNGWWIYPGEVLILP